MNTLDYIHDVFQNALNSCQRYDEMSPSDFQSLLLSISDKIEKELGNNFLKVCMDILEHNPHLANRHCCGNYMLPIDKVEIMFSKKLNNNIE